MSHKRDTDIYNVTISPLTEYHINLLKKEGGKLSKKYLQTCVRPKFLEKCENNAEKIRTAFSAKITSDFSAI